MIHVLLGPAVNPNGTPYPHHHLQHVPNWDCLCHWHKVAAMKCEREGGVASADVVAATHSFKCHFKLK